MKKDRQRHITNIKLSNFKSFSEPVNFPIRPITLLFGPNSAGKSSFIKALLLMKQSVLYGDYRQDLVPSGKIIDLGSYKDIVFNNDVNRDLSLSFEFKPSFEPCIFDTLRIPRRASIVDIINHYDNIRISMTFRNNHSNNNIGISSFKLYLGNEEAPLMISQVEEGFKYNTNHSLWKLHWEKFNEKIYNEELIRLFNPNSNVVDGKSREMFKNIKSDYITFEQTMKLNEFSSLHLEREGVLEAYNFRCLRADCIHSTLGEIISSYSVSSRSPFLIPFIIKQYISEFIKNVDHIGPIRDFPQRAYFLEPHGDTIIHILNQNPDLIKNVNIELQKLNISYEIQLQNLSAHETGLKNYWALNLMNKKNGRITNVCDVGFGVSQLLPIILKCCLSLVARLSDEDHLSNGMICIEQPELHLHPAMQAGIADLFIKTALTNDKEIAAKSFGLSSRFYADHNIWAPDHHPNLIIETHSEHLILRILRRIRETSEGKNNETPPIYPEDVSVLYIKPGEDGSKVFHLPITADGDFDCEWPDGFFDEREKELFF